MSTEDGLMRGIEFRQPTMHTHTNQELLDMIKRVFGGSSEFVLYTDGSGHIKTGNLNSERKEDDWNYVHFHNLWELEKILYGKG